MNKQDTENVLNIVNASYPQYLKHMTPIERKTQLSVWYDLLGDYETPDVAASVKRHIATNKYPPSIADIRESIKLINKLKQARARLEGNKRLLTNGQFDRLTKYKSQLAKVEEEIASGRKSDENIKNLRLKRHELKCNIEFLEDEELRLQRQAEKELERAERAWEL